MTAKKKVELSEPYTPVKWEIPDASALQALARGEADSGQQQRVLNWIMYQACGTYELGYHPDARDHAFLAGRRFVGLEIVKLLKINTAAFAKKE